MKVLITGAAGQLGTDLVAHCLEHGDEVNAFERSGLDISDREGVMAAVRSASPDVIFNCAAWTAVDDCESDPERAHRINGTSVANLGEAAEAAAAHLVQISTDYVFDGTKIGPYEVDDETNPTSVYGRSKLAGERSARQAGATIVRTAWVFSRHGGNMVATALRLAKEHETLRFVCDQRGSPTATRDLARALRQVGADRVDGVLHVTNEGDATWHQFVQDVFAAAGLDPNRVEPIATADLQPARPAPRPANSVLSNDRFHALGYDPLPHYRVALADVVPAYL